MSAERGGASYHVARVEIAARANIVVLAVIWGLDWIAAKIVLRDLSPWSFRTITFGLGALILMLTAKRRGGSLRIGRG
jgi:drug/metabolite transporter (DMT)-like permease